MKLINAPVIVTRLDPQEKWFKAAAKETRQRFARPPETNRQGDDQTNCDLKQLAEDIWAIDGPLGLHTDKTRRGFRVFGLVLINEPALVLATDERIYTLRPGTVYHIDGRAPHGALCRLGGPAMGIFGFMAWDVHRHENVEEMLASIPDSMRAYAAGEERVDVSLAGRDVSELEDG